MTTVKTTEAVDLQKDAPDNPLGGLYKVVTPIPSEDLRRKNEEKSWHYGYHPQYDVVVISRTGEVGEVYNIQGLNVALPPVPDYVWSRHPKPEEQYWEREELPKPLAKIKSIFQWKSMPKDFKDKWVDYIERQFEYRENGFWFMNNGVPTYMTGDNWMYVQWSVIDVGHPEYREAARILYLFWEACVADKRSFGMDFVKIRRFGFTFIGMASHANAGTLTRKALLGIVSKTGKDARSMFILKLVPILRNYPFFFKPIQEGSTAPKTEISFRLPAKKITRNNMLDDDDDDLEGLETTIDWRNTGNNTYDGEKLFRLFLDEHKKYEKPNNILESWRVQKTCLRQGRKISGKCMAGSTVNAQDKGGAEGRKLWDDSDLERRDENGQTKSGLYRIFIPLEYCCEGFIDRHGMPVLHTPEEPVMGVDGEWIDQGAIEWWENTVKSLQSDPDALNEFYRQNPRTVDHAFRDESENSLFNLTKIYEQIDYNNSLIIEHHVTRGNFHWMNGQRFSKVVFEPNPRGRFHLAWIPPAHLQNNVIKRGDKFYPGNEHIGCFGCDSYDISGAVDEARASKAALIGMTMVNMDQAPSMQIISEYISRPKTAEICFEDMLMCLWFYGMPVLAENNKVRFLYWLKNAGMRAFSMNRPDKHKNKLSKTELELGGIPNTSEDVKQAHAAAIESYIEKYIGVDHQGIYREAGDMGWMPFNRILNDWARFDINNRTRHDASIASGLAIMANQKHLYTPVKKKDPISISFASYDNSGLQSRIIQ